MHAPSFPSVDQYGGVLAESYKLDPGLPPYITAAIVLVWLVAVGGAVAIILYRRAIRRERRRPPARVADPDQPAIGPGNDIEPW